jgi:hypothetical protein
VTGGGGADAFLWRAVDEIGLFNFDPEIITDFNRAEGDYLHFTLIDADATVAGNQDFTFIDTAVFTAPGQINWATNGTDTFITLNTNADPTVEGVIQIFGVHTVDATGSLCEVKRRMREAAMSSFPNFISRDFHEGCWIGPLALRRSSCASATFGSGSVRQLTTVVARPVRP